jgi:hypothetical protein
MMVNHKRWWDIEVGLYISAGGQAKTGAAIAGSGCPAKGARWCIATAPRLSPKLGCGAQGGAGLLSGGCVTPSPCETPAPPTIEVLS